MGNKKIRIAITHGDTNGIGYEVIFKAFSEPAMLELCTPIIYGSPKVAAYHRNALGMDASFTIISKAEDAAEDRINLLTVFDEEIKVELGHPSKDAGAAALKALDCAMRDYKAGLFDVLVTAPINKNNIQGEGFDFCGHTEYIEERAGEGSKSLMILFENSLRVALLTTHLPVKDIAAAVTKERIKEKATILFDSLKRDFRVANPRMAILGLNPHAGDDGLLGSEEKDIIAPAVEELTAEGVNVFGPYPADGFFGNGSYRAFDGILAMYHDQGLAPFKALSSGNSVNYTAGLPIVRTSPGHGTAYDIAGKGVADESSFRNAIYAAIDIFRNRADYDEPLQNPLKKLYHERKDDSDGEGNWVKTAFDIIADTEGCTLFHCFAGKDRTGLVAMLLLGLVGVSDEDIMQNYSVSYDFIKDNPKIKEIIEKDIENFGEAAIGKYHATPPSKIKHGIDYISENYGTTENYLLACGVSRENLDKIKNRFVE